MPEGLGALEALAVGKLEVLGLAVELALVAVVTLALLERTAVGSHFSSALRLYFFFVHPSVVIF